MKLNKKCKVEEITSGDKNRQAIWNVKLECEGEGKGKLIALDGRVLVVLPVEVEEGDTAGLISPEAIKAGRKNRAADDMVQIKANGNLGLPNGSTLPRPTEEEYGRFPTWQQVMPKEEEQDKFAICFDAELLVKLQRAMGCEFVTLKFKDDCSSILVKPSGEHQSAVGAVGVLMPARMA